MADKNPLIQGIQIIPRDVKIPVARFLSQDEVNAYQERVKQKYANNQKALNSLLADVQRAERVLRFNEKIGEPEHSNFWVVAELQAMGIPVASAETLDILAGTNPDALRGHYEDAPALVLRSPSDQSYSTNNPVIVDLISQLAKRTKKKGIKYPVLISGIAPTEGKTDYGLLAKLGEQTKVYFDVGELAYSNNHKTFSRTDERGVPIFDKDGTRTFYAKSSGLSWLFLYRGLFLISNIGSLAYSNSDGRVVVEIGEANAQKLLQNYTTKIKEQRTKYIKELEAKFNKAVSRLDNGYAEALKEL